MVPLSIRVDLLGGTAAALFEGRAFPADAAGAFFGGLLHRLRILIFHCHLDPRCQLHLVVDGGDLVVVRALGLGGWVLRLSLLRDVEREPRVIDGERHRRDELLNARAQPFAMALMDLFILQRCRRVASRRLALGVEAHE